ncbi:Trm112 family protein [Litorivita pollutaquae]
MMDDTRSAETPEVARELGFDPKMLEALVCPQTQSVLEYDAAAQELISRSAHLAYPIRNGIPVMLVDEARRLE